MDLKNFIITKKKYISALCIVSLMSLNTYSAIISDNDGSAFVSKYERDCIAIYKIQWNKLYISK